VIDGLAFTLTVGAFGLAVLVAGLAVAGRFRARRPAPLLVLLELGLLGQAALDVAGLAGGHRVAALPTHLAYLVTSVLLLPAVVGWAFGGRRAPDRWSALVLAAGLLAVAVVVVRLMTTWR
jgi:hypothetical protein